MQEVSKQEVEWLLSKGYLKQERGQIPDLTVTSKRKRKNGKTRLVPDPIFNKLSRAQGR